MKITIIVIALLLILGISVAGISGGIGVIEPIQKEKIIPDVEYDSLKVVLEKGGVTIDDKIGLDITWTENKCIEVLDENKVQTGTTCEYALHKENLFQDATINVSYNLTDSIILKQTKLDNAIQDKVNFVKRVWEERQAKIEEENQTGTTIFKTDKREVK